MGFARERWDLTGFAAADALQLCSLTANITVLTDLPVLYHPGESDGPFLTDPGETGGQPVTAKIFRTTIYQFIALRDAPTHQQSTTLLYTSFIFSASQWITLFWK